MTQTTCIYLERDGRILMLHRVTKKHDLNHGKWIGIGGHIEEGETPEQCIRREVFEETGFTLGTVQRAGIVDFHYDEVFERVYFFKSCDFSGAQIPCSEGVAEWIPKEQVKDLNLWEGDRKFLPYLLSDEKLYFKMNLIYTGDVLRKAELVSLDKEEGN